MPAEKEAALSETSLSSLKDCSRILVFDEDLHILHSSFQVAQALAARYGSHAVSKCEEHMLPRTASASTLSIFSHAAGTAGRASAPNRPFW